MIEYDYHNIVKEELDIFIKKFQDNPFEFLTEYDLQSYLYFKIFDNFEKKKIKIKIETSKDDKKLQIFNPSQMIEINPTRREYTAFDGFDIAIIDDTKLKPTSYAYWHQKLKVAIEIKYHRSSMGNSINKLIKGFKKDIDKLSEYHKRIGNNNFKGLAILFIQNISEEKEKEIEKTLQLTKEYSEIKNISDVLFLDTITGIVISKTKIYQKLSSKLF